MRNVSEFTLVLKVISVAVSQTLSTVVLVSVASGTANQKLVSLKTKSNSEETLLRG